LIIMSPKSLLRHKLVVSRLEEMGPDTSFHRVLHDPVLPGHPAQARQMVLCSGKVYYDLVEEREKRGITDVHFLRVEQLYPFPFEALEEELAPYMHCKLVWCQEEPRNMGAWPLMSEMLGEVVSGMGFADPRIRYAGRHAAAAPATGVHARHVAEQARLVDEALTVGLEPVGRIQARTFRAEQAARNGKTGR